MNDSQEVCSRESYFVGSSTEHYQQGQKRLCLEEHEFLKKQCTSLIESIKEQDNNHKLRMEARKSVITVL